MYEKFVPDTPELEKLSKYLLDVFQPGCIRLKKFDDCTLLAIDRQGGILKASYKDGLVVLNDGNGPQPMMAQKPNGDLMQTGWYEDCGSPIEP